MMGALGGIAAVFSLKLPLFRMQGLNIFGLLNLLYVDLVVLLPLLAMSLLLYSARGKARRLSIPAAVASWLTLAAVPIGIYATFIEPFRLQTETASISVPGSRTGSSPIRIGVLADIQINHVSDYERGAIDRLMALKPDLILIPGDVFQATMEQFEREEQALRELFGRLNAPGGVYLVLGDVDWNGDVVRRITQGTRVKLLVNEMARVKVGDRALVVGGIELNYGTDAARNLIAQLEALPGETDIRILLTHRPDVALDMKGKSRIDLVVAGHTHGGQVVVPLFGPPMTLSRVPRDVASGGLHRIHENQIYVSRGVGCERGQAPRIRFLCPPEISLLTVGPAVKSR